MDVDYRSLASDESEQTQKRKREYSIEVRVQGLQNISEDLSVACINLRDKEEVRSIIHRNKF